MNLTKMLPSLAPQSNQQFQDQLKVFALCMQILGGLTTIPVVYAACESRLSFLRSQPYGEGIIWTICMLAGAIAAWLLDGKSLGLFIKTFQYLLAIVVRKDARKNALVISISLLLLCLTVITLYLSVWLTSSKSGVFLADMLIKDGQAASAVALSSSYRERERGIASRLSSLEGNLAKNTSSTLSATYAMESERMKKDASWYVVSSKKSELATLAVEKKMLESQIKASQSALSKAQDLTISAQKSDLTKDSLSNLSFFDTRKRKAIVVQMSDGVGKWSTGALLVIVLLSLLLQVVPVVSAVQVPVIATTAKVVDREKNAKPGTFSHNGTEYTKSQVKARVDQYARQVADNPSDANKKGHQYWSDALKGMG